MLFPPNPWDAIHAEVAARAERGDPPMDPSQLIAFVSGLRRNSRGADAKRRLRPERLDSISSLSRERLDVRREGIEQALKPSPGPLSKMRTRIRWLQASLP
jgi:hypothetical protein